MNLPDNIFDHGITISSRFIKPLLRANPESSSLTFIDYIVRDYHCESTSAYICSEINIRQDHLAFAQTELQFIRSHIDLDKRAKKSCQRIVDESPL